VSQYDLVEQQTKKKRGCSSIAIFAVSALVVVILIIFAYVGNTVGGRMTGNATRDCQADMEHYRIDTLSPLLTEWKDAFDLAAGSPKITLPTQIANLQAIRRKANDADAEGCAAVTHLLVISAMDNSIDGFMAFLADKPNSEVERRFNAAEILLRQAMSDSPDGTPTAKPTARILHYAFIEARDTCPDSPEYRSQVAQGATLWDQAGTGSNSGIIPHGKIVGVISEDAEWAHIDYDGKGGYIQSFFLVDYDPLAKIEPATGKRHCLLCASNCGVEGSAPTPTLDDSIERTVVYELSVIDNPGTWMMSVNYKEPSGGLHQEKHTVPWRYEFKSLAGAEVAVSVKNGLNHNRFECKITVNGETLAHDEGWGERAEAECNGVVP
jgi:hypothetical protein